MWVIPTYLRCICAKKYLKSQVIQPGFQTKLRSNQTSNCSQYRNCTGRQGRIRTAVKGFADPYLTTRPHDCMFIV